MGIATVRPTTLIQTGNATVVGASAIAALTDSTDPTGTSGDGTRVDLPGSAGDRNRGMVVSCATPSIPAGAKIVGVAVRMRAKSSAGGRARVQPSTKAPTTTAYNQTPGVRSDYGNLGIAYYQGGYDAADAYGHEWTAASVSNLQLLLTNAGSGTVSVYDVWVDVLYNENPTVTIVAPPATVATVTPEIDWQYADPDNDPPASYWLKVFTLAQTQAAGFNPTSSAAIIDTGWYPSSDNPAAYVVPNSASLQNGQTYVAYVKARQQWYGFGTNESAWASLQFAVVISPPPTPTISAVVDSAQARMNVTVTPGAGAAPPNVIPNPDAEVNANNWTGSNGTVSRSTAQAHAGTASFLLTVAANGSAYAYAPTFPVQPGGYVHVDAWVRAAATPRTRYVQLDFYDANGVWLTTKLSHTVLDSASAWTEIVDDLQVPPGAVTAMPSVWTAGAAAGELSYFDDVNVFAWDSFDVQHSDDGGITWVPMRWGTGLNSIGLPVTASAYEAIPGTPRIFRAQAIRVAAGNALRSPWSGTSAPLTLTLARWRLHYPMDPSKNMNVRWNGEDVSLDTEEATQINYALGRPNAIVISSVIRGASFDLKLSFPNDTEFAAFQALRAVQDVLYLMSPQGWAKYVRMTGKMSDKRDLTAGAVASAASGNWHEITVTVVEQDRP